MTAIKICGITEPIGLQAALAQKVARIGLVFAPGSPRALDIKTACALAEIARDKTAILAVLVNPGDKALTRIVHNLRPNFLQLHGKESPDRVRSIWKRFHIPIIKAFPIATAQDIEDTARYQHTAAEFLLDAKPPKEAMLAGGHGTCFNWELLGQSKLARPWLLAGGLNAQNVKEAINVTHAPMLDVSSGVESAPGVKDPARIDEFCAQVKQADQENEQT